MSLLVHGVLASFLILSGMAYLWADSVVSATKPVEFPPKFVPSSDPQLPAGHLMPFGYQRPPLGRVKEYLTVLHPQEFWNKHVSQNLPLVFRGT